MKRKSINFLLIALFLLISNSGFSQIVPPAPNQRPGPGLPIDGGVVVLLVAGAAYGIKKLRK